MIGQKEQFVFWLKKQKNSKGGYYSPSAIDIIVRTYENCIKSLNILDAPYLSLFEYTNLEEFLPIYEKIINNPLYRMSPKSGGDFYAQHSNYVIYYKTFLTEVNLINNVKGQEHLIENLNLGEKNMNINACDYTTTEDKIVFTDRKDLPLSTILEMYNDGDIITQPDYQRDYIMDDKKASKLVESILLQISIPTIYLCEECDGRSSVIDGQQRITSFVRYLSNEFKLAGLEELTTLNGKYFKDLEKTYQRKIKQTAINSIVIKKESQDLKYEIFARLNQGSVKLKPQELRNCIYRGPLNNLIESIAKENQTLPLLFHSENNRKQYQEYILRFFALKNFNECSSSLKKTMNDYMAKNQNLDKNEIDKLKNLFNSKIDIIKQIFGETAFCSYDRQNDKITKSFSGSVYDSLIIPCSFFDNHSLMVHANELRKQFEYTKRNNLEYQDYTYAATGSKSRVIGRIMLIYNLISNIIKNENTKRIFDYSTKEYLWANRDHVCAFCKQEILDINDAEVDHIFAYSKGGETIIENAQLLHKHCNRVKNSNADIDSVNFEDEVES